MNFDGKALVVNQHYDAFYSDNDSAVVMPPDFITEFNQDIGSSNVVIEELTISKEEHISSSYVINNLVPYTIQVYEDEALYEPSISFKPTETVYISDVGSRYGSNYCFENVKVTDLLLSTNVFIKEVTAYVIDTEKNMSAKEFPAVYATIVDKTEITIPSVSTGYQEMSLVVQKDNFIELKFSDTIVNVIGLPDGLEFVLGVIKGTITKSGTYDITIQYNDNSQKLNIMVPYYQRLL